MLGMLARVLVAVAVLSGCGVVGGDDPLGAGGGESRSTSGASAAVVGQQLAFGPTVLTNDTDEDAILVSARLVPTGVAGGVEPVAVFAVNTLDARGIPAAGTWPKQVNYTATSLHPVPGYRVAPNSAVRLLFILDVKDAGRWSFSGVQLTYMHSGWFNQEVTDDGFVACVELLPDCQTFA